jgi:peptidoglycan/LPS O-acetylase OafA/YrhL
MRYKLLSLILFIIALILHLLCTLEYLNYDITGVFTSIILAIVIILNLKGDSFFSKILNNNFLEKIGILSYSLYIWQQLFTIKQAWWSIFPLEISICINLILLILTSYFSYNYIEKKFIELRKKLY